MLIDVPFSISVLDENRAELNKLSKKRRFLFSHAHQIHYAIKSSVNVIDIFFKF